MKSKIVEETNTKELPFPKLMKSTGKELVILAVGRSIEYIEGTVVHSSDGPSALALGSRSTTWSAKRFEDFDGTIQLSN